MSTAAGSRGKRSADLAGGGERGLQLADPPLVGAALPLVAALERVDSAPEVGDHLRARLGQRERLRARIAPVVATERVEVREQAPRRGGGRDGADEGGGTGEHRPAPTGVQVP
jgi:hypothetical protein